MKKLIVIICFIFVNLNGFAKICSLPTPKQVFGDTTIICIVPVCSGTTSNFYFHPGGFQTGYSYVCQGVRYYSTQPYIDLTFDVPNDTTIMCYVDSMNGIALEVVKAIGFRVRTPYTFSIPINSIKHVTCPNGNLYQYTDGGFYVDLDNPVQDYLWIDVRSDSSFFGNRRFFGNFSINNLRAGTYHVIARGTNGCEYHDSVTIEQPEPWLIDPTISRIDTVCHDSTGCICVDIVGGTPPYTFIWSYFDGNSMYPIAMDDTTRMVCGLYSDRIYCVNMYDSRGCKAYGEETHYIFMNLYEYIEDTTHLITTKPIACYNSPFLIQAQSMDYGSYAWHVGDSIDTANYSTWVAGDSMLIADYYTPPMTESTWISVDFSDQHGCITHDSIWVDVYNSNISMTIHTQEIMSDSMYTVQVAPPGGNLYMDDNLIASNIPSSYTFSTAGVSAGEHVLKYTGVFGSEVGLNCEDEVSITIQVQVQPFVTAWDQEISIYPNPTTTVLNLSSTEMMDFSIFITDITGRVISTEKVSDSSHVIDVSNLTSGIYLLCMKTPKGASKSMKFIKR